MMDRVLVYSRYFLTDEPTDFLGKKIHYFATPNYDVMKEQFPELHHKSFRIEQIASYINKYNPNINNVHIVSVELPSGIDAVVDAGIDVIYSGRFKSMEVAAGYINLDLIKYFTGRSDILNDPRVFKRLEERENLDNDSFRKMMGNFWNKLVGRVDDEINFLATLYGLQHFADGSHIETQFNDFISIGPRLKNCYDHVEHYYNCSVELYCNWRDRNWMQYGKLQNTINVLRKSLM